MRQMRAEQPPSVPIVVSMSIGTASIRQQLRIWSSQTRSSRLLSRSRTLDLGNDDPWASLALASWLIAVVPGQSKPTAITWRTGFGPAVFKYACLMGLEGIVQASGRPIPERSVKGLAEIEEPAEGNRPAKRARKTGGRLSRFTQKDPCSRDSGTITRSVFACPARVVVPTSFVSVTNNPGWLKAAIASTTSLTGYARRSTKFARPPGALDWGAIPPLAYWRQRR